MAFAEHGLDWYWSVANYCEMLKETGRIERIASFSNGALSTDQVNVIHAKKEAFFKDYLQRGVKPRAESVDCISNGR